MKHSSLIFGILLSGLLGLGMNVAITQAADDEPQDKIMAELFEYFEIEEDFSNDPAGIEDLGEVEEDELAFENLYVFMYQNTKQGPHETAITELSQRTIYSKDELNDIVLNGATKPIQNNGKVLLDGEVTDLNPGNNTVSDDFWIWKASTSVGYKRVPDVKKTTDQVLEEYALILESYERELEFQRDNRRLAYDILASEIFYNNKLGDSAGIDILYDLDTLHHVLFNSYIDFPDRSGDSEVNLASEILLAEQDAALADWDIELASEGEDETEDFDAIVCYEDDDLRDELEKFEAYVETLDEEGRDPETGAYAVVSDLSQIGQAESKSVSEQEEEEEAESLEQLVDAFSVTPGDWTRSLPCNERFCITIDLRKSSWGTTSGAQGSVGSYEERDNCVACHIAYIQDAMAETMSKSLVAGKVSMNAFEDATCKEAGSLVNLDMNVYTIAKPVVLDPGNDFVEKAVGDLDELQNKLVSLGVLFQMGEEIPKRTLTDMVCGGDLNLQQMLDQNVSLQQVQDDCEAALAEHNDAVTEAIEAHQYETRASLGTDLYEVLGSQLYSMLQVFENMQADLEATISTGNKPLYELTNKRSC